MTGSKFAYANGGVDRVEDLPHVLGRVERRQQMALERHRHACVLGVPRELAQARDQPLARLRQVVLSRGAVVEGRMQRSAAAEDHLRAEGPRRAHELGERGDALGAHRGVGAHQVRAQPRALRDADARVGEHAASSRPRDPASEPARHVEVGGDPRDAERGDLLRERGGQLIRIGGDQALRKSEMKHRRMVR